MSITDPSADPVQPEGQGGEGTSGAPYQEYLDRIPEEVRGDVEPVFKDWDANYTRRQQEAAEYRSQWQPYEEAGVRNLQPGELQELIEFRKALAENPQGVRDWYQTYAQANNLNQPAASDEEQPWVDPNVQALQQEIQDLRAQFGDVSAWRQQQEEQAKQAQLSQSLEEAFSSLQEKHGAAFDGDLVESFIPKHFDPANPRLSVEKAWADAQQFRSQIEKQVLQSKTNPPVAPTGGGGTVTESGLPTTMADATEQARVQLRAMYGR